MNLFQIMGEEDQLQDAWHDKCVDEKEEIMNKYKNNKI